MAAPDPGFPITLHGLLVVWQLIGAPLVAAVFFYVRDISKQLRKMNGRIIQCETWAMEKEKRDGDAADSTRRELDQIQRELRASRERQV